jgi:hypothetical protein
VASTPIPLVQLQMTRVRTERWLLAGICVLCAVVCNLAAFVLEPTEFSGGWVTSRLLSLNDVSAGFFLLSAALAFFRPRAAAATGLVAVAFAVPLCAYFVAPGLFQAIVRGEYSVPAASFFGSSPSVLSASAVLIVAAALCVRGVVRR